MNSRDDTVREDGMQQGGCQCGATRYLAPLQPTGLYVCHCNQCRKQSASAFGISFTVRRDALQLTRGQPQFWSRPTRKGFVLECAFCAQGGSRLWHQSSGFPEHLNIKGGSLHVPPDLSAAVHIRVEEQLPGVLIPPGAITHLREPDDLP